MAKKSFKNWWNNLISGVESWWKDFTGQNAEAHAQKADQLAEEAQQYNESYTQQTLAQQQAQYEKTNELAQQNLDFQKDIAEKNLSLQQDAFNAQQRENEIAREREDTAYQRQVADLKAAGLSPLMVSNGASAASMSVGSAPQYETSGVSAAQGSMIQLANEYAQLMNMARGNHISSRQAAINQRIAAQQVLSDVSRERRTNFQNMALSTSNLAMDLSRLKKQNALTDEQIATAKSQREYNETYGFRNNNWISELRPLITTLADSLGINYEALGEALSNLNFNFNTSINQLSDLYDGSDEGFGKLKDKTEVLKGAEISKDSFDDLLAQLTQPEKVSSDTITNWYNSMNKDFQDRFSYGYFYDAVTGKNKFKRSFLLKYLLFGNSGNI